MSNPTHVTKFKSAAASDPSYDIARTSLDANFKAKFLTGPLVSERNTQLEMAAYENLLKENSLFLRWKF
jgi:hypothetical protein